MNKTLLLIPAIPMLAAAGAVVAEPIQYEVSAWSSYSSNEITSASSYVAHSFFSAGLVGTYYLAPIETTGVVQNELAFLRRTGFVSADISHYDYDYDYTFRFNDGGTLTDDGRYDERSGGIGGQYFVNENAFIGGYYNKTFASGADGVASVFGGYYYSDASAVSAGLTQQIGHSDSTSFFVSNKSVVSLSEGSSLAYSLGTGAAFDAFEESVSIDFDTTYYFTNHTGVGIAGDYYIDASEFSYSVSFNHYFNDRIGINMWVAEPDEGFDHYGASLTGRF